MQIFANPTRSARRQTRLRPLSLTALAVAVSLATAGCSGSGGDQPSTTPPVTTTMTSTATTSTPPVTTTSQTSTVPTTTKAVPPAVAGIPAAARAKTDVGAEAFAKYFWTQLGKVVTNVEPAEIIGLYEPTCALCQGFVKDFAGFKAKGETVRGGEVSVLRVSVLGGDASDTQVIVTYDQADIARFDKDGKILESSKGSTNARSGLRLAFRAGRWTVLEAGGAG